MMTLSFAESTIGARQCCLEYFTLRNAARETAKLSDLDRIALREALRESVALMRESEHARDLSIRIRLARQALEQLFVIAAAAHRKSESAGPVEWPELASAAQVVSEMSELKRHAVAIAYVRDPQRSLSALEPQYGKLADLFADLERHIDLRSGRDVFVTRWLRRAAAACLLFACSWLAFSPTNLARGKMVTASSLCAETPAHPLGESRLARVVDGRHSEQTFAMCTSTELRPWVMVDLGVSRDIHEVVIYPLNKGSWTDRVGPLEIQVSNDDLHYTTIAARALPIISAYPWRVQFKSRNARFVRVAGVSAAPQSIILSEIEVYGE